MTSALAASAAVVAMLMPSTRAQDSPAGFVRRAAVDTVIGVQDVFGADRDWPTQLIVDTMATAELAPRLQVSMRPVFWRVNGAWESLVDQLSVRYEFAAGSQWRIEAGRFPSSVGLGMLENRANVNGGVLWCHRAYYMPLPSLGPGLPAVSLASAVYPNGVMVSTSGDRWDARGGVVDRAPVQFWHPGPEGAARSANGVIGGGVTPRQGLRLGVATAWGEYGEAAGLDGSTLGYRLVNVEGDYAFGYTRVSGEWTRDVFETPVGDRVAAGWTLQARHTLAPRLFVHSRFSTISASEVDGASVVTPRRFTSLDTTVGYLVSPELTLRLAHAAVRGWSGGAVDHQAGISLIWFRRWW